MESSAQNIEIIQDFDSLINRVQTDIKESLEKYNEDQILGQLQCFEVKNRDFKVNPCFKLYFFDSSPEKKALNQWTESTKVVDYLNQVRSRTIKELKNAQKESLENYILDEIDDDEKNIELENETSSNKFYHQVQIKRSDELSWIFNIYTFVTDFYMSPSDIDLLE